MNIDFSKFTSLPWLKKNTILLTKHGSHAYGTNLPTSDLDIKGVAIPPSEYFTGFTQHFEQAEGRDPDMVIYGIRKFFKLATDCNPSIIEVLWTDESDQLISTRAGDLLRENRNLFLSKKAKFTFSGYAISQLKRIRTHRRWLIDPPDHQPTRAEYDLPQRTVIPADQLATAQSLIQKKLDMWEWKHLEGLDKSTIILVKEAFAKAAAEMKLHMDQGSRFLAAGRSVGITENFLALLEREKKYSSALKDWQSYKKWQKERNPERAVLEAKYGYDTKHGMHLVRLMRMCREILTEKKVYVKRPDAEELLAIRHGEWPYDKLIEWADVQDEEMNVLYKTSPLPHKPPRADLDLLCRRMVWASMDNWGSP